MNIFLKTPAKCSISPTSFTHDNISLSIGDGFAEIQAGLYPNKSEQIQLYDIPIPGIAGKVSGTISPSEKRYKLNLLHPFYEKKATLQINGTWDHQGNLNFKGDCLVDSLNQILSKVI